MKPGDPPIVSTWEVLPTAMGSALTNVYLDPKAAVLRQAEHDVAAALAAEAKMWREAERFAVLAELDRALDTLHDAVPGGFVIVARGNNARATQWQAWADNGDASIMIPQHAPVADTAVEAILQSAEHIRKGQEDDDERID